MEYQPLATFEHWPDLPGDIQQDILLKLTIKDLLNFTSCNSLMLEKMNKNNLLWRTLYYQRAGAANDLKESTNTSDWKIRYQEMFEKAHLWTCTLCSGFPIASYAYKCWYCEDFTCCQTCYEKHGHFKNHVLLKYYNRLGDAKIHYRIDNRHDYDLLKPKCAKCQIALKFPTNRSVTDQRIYLCDTCLGNPEFAQHTIYRVVKPEVELDTEMEDASITCMECDNSYNVTPGADDWPYTCLTCRKSYNSGDLCAKCHASSAVLAKHQGHNIIPRPVPNYHSCLCDICRWSMRYGVRYRCSVCFDYDFCEPCEPLAAEHFDGTHPMMIINQQRQRNHLKWHREDKSSDSSSDSGSESMGEIMYTE